MTEGRVFAAIDVGTSKVCTLVGRLDAAREMQVVGVGLVPSRGMRKGMVSNISDVQQVVRASVQEAEAQAGVSISSAFVGLTGSHINYVNSRASLDNRRYGNLVAAGDLDQVIQACYAQGAASGGRILHVIPRGYAVDGHWGVKNPVGMYSSTLEVESHVVRGDPSPIDNLVEALRKAGVTARGLVLEPLASAEAVLVGEEREMGVVLVDIGGGTSDVSIFLDGNIWHTGIIPVGGFQFTQDVSIAFTTPFQAAEEAKVRYGHVIPENIDPEEVVRLPGFREELSYKVPRQRLCQVLHERMEELLRIILVQIKKSGLEAVPPGGLVLTGGSAKMPGLEDLAHRMFPGPVRIGVPKAKAWVPRNLEGPSFSTALGLLLWDAKHESRNDRSENGHGDNGNGGKINLSSFRHGMNNLTRRVRRYQRRGHSGESVL